MATEFAAAGPPDLNFNPGILQPFTDPRAAFAAGVSNKVQAVLATVLTTLLVELQNAGAVRALQVIEGYTAQDPTLLGVGRALLFRHPSVAADRLSGYALQAGFGFVQHRTLDPGGPAVYAAAYPASGPPSVLPDPDSNYINVYLNTLIELGIRPEVAIAGRLDWGVLPACPAAAALSSTLPEPTDQPGITEKVFQGTAAGAIAAVATFSLNDASDPYQFVVTPVPAGGNGSPPQPTITKDQYDDMMNFLDAYHPVAPRA